MSINDNLRDVAYVAIGLSVLGFQRAQVRREELRKQLDEVVKAVDAHVDTVVERLPDQARQVIGAARGRVTSA